jgi:hypothetical protein
MVEGWWGCSKPVGSLSTISPSLPSPLSYRFLLKGCPLFVPTALPLAVGIEKYKKNHLSFLQLPSPESRRRPVSRRRRRLAIFSVVTCSSLSVSCTTHHLYPAIAITITPLSKNTQRPADKMVQKIYVTYNDVRPTPLTPPNSPQTLR